MKYTIPGQAETPDQMRAEISKLMRDNPTVRSCIQVADSRGMSGEDRYTLLAYHALVALGLTQNAFDDHLLKCAFTLVKQNQSPTTT